MFLKVSLRGRATYNSSKLTNVIGQGSIGRVSLLPTKARFAPHEVRRPYSRHRMMGSYAARGQDCPALDSGIGAKLKRGRRSLI